MTMPGASTGARIDRDLILRHTAFTEDGIEERALQVPVGDGYCFAIMYLPTGQPAEPGLAVCHSYGLEFLTLRRIERAVARGLAKQGHPVIAFHARGYGDSSGSLADTSVGSHLEDLAAALGQLRTQTGVDRLGVIGARFGALIAGLAAREGTVERLVLINPDLSGKRYFKRFLHEMRLVRLAEGEETTSDPMKELSETGMVDVLGHPLYRHMYEECARVDLTSDMGRFDGRALAVHFSKSTRVPGDLLRWRQTVEDAGGTCSIEAVLLTEGVGFGAPTYVSTTDPNVREDRQSASVARGCALVEQWVKS